jgi:hypothetical protein
MDGVWRRSRDRSFFDAHTTTSEPKDLKLMFKNGRQKPVQLFATFPSLDGNFR